MRIHESADSNFLSFSLISQQLITVAFALCCFYQQRIVLVIFYMSIASALSVTLGIFYVYKRHNVARFLLVSTLAAGFLLLLVGTSDPTSLMWCLTIVPILAGTLGYWRSLLLLIALFAVSIWLLIGGAIPFITHQYDHMIIVHFLSSYAILAMFSVALDNAPFKSRKSDKILSSKMQEMAYRDMLTSLPNRHHMEERLKLEYQRYSLSSEVFSVVLADMDNFKAINDQYGRDTGDRILKTTGQLLNNELREGDLVARWSGNQFILLLPDVNHKAATKIAERLRVQVAQLALESQGDQLGISISMGIASMERSIGLDDLLSCAENAVYQAKRMGRNMVVVS